MVDMDGTIEQKTIELLLELKNSGPMFGTTEHEYK